jgi:hypothetical protein
VKEAESFLNRFSEQIHCQDVQLERHSYFERLCLQERPSNKERNRRSVCSDGSSVCQYVAVVIKFNDWVGFSEVKIQLFALKTRVLIKDRMLLIYDFGKPPGILDLFANEYLSSLINGYISFISISLRVAVCNFQLGLQNLADQLLQPVFVLNERLLGFTEYSQKGFLLLN